MVTAAEDVKAEHVESEKEKEKTPFWTRMPTWQKIAILGVGFLIIRSMMLSTEAKGSSIFWLVGLAVLIYILSQSKEVKDAEVVTPREAELLVERELKRKMLWNQFDPMTKYKVGPVSNYYHNDAVGKFYHVAVEAHNPYDKPKYYTGFVIARGDGIRFTTLQRNIGPLTGRERLQTRTVMSEFFKLGTDNAFAGNLIMDRIKRGGHL